MHPGDRIDVQTRLALAGGRRAVVPRAELESPAMVSGAEDEDVALADLHALAGRAFLQFHTPDDLPRLQPRDVAGLRDIEEHAPSDDALVVDGNVLLGCAVCAQHLVSRPPVIGETVIRDVAERVNIRLAVAMCRSPQPI